MIYHVIPDIGKFHFALVYYDKKRRGKAKDLRIEATGIFSDHQDILIKNFYLKEAQHTVSSTSSSQSLSIIGNVLEHNNEMNMKYVENIPDGSSAMEIGDGGGEGSGGEGATGGGSGGEDSGGESSTADSCSLSFPSASLKSYASSYSSLSSTSFPLTAHPPNFIHYVGELKRKQMIIIETYVLL